MSTLSKRIHALENVGSGGLQTVLISWLPSGGRETATYEGVTYTQDIGETAEQFRARLAQAMWSSKQSFVWVSELDAAL
jgi:argininosuccinate synthase